eukprot:scaffold25999_cov88-Cyclotella_meneghiniana.AAC.2
MSSVKVSKLQARNINSHSLIWMHPNNLRQPSTTIMMNWNRTVMMIWASLCAKITIILNQQSASSPYRTIASARRTTVSSTFSSITQEELNKLKLVKKTPDET